MRYALIGTALTSVLVAQAAQVAPVVSINGAVKQPGDYSFVDGMTVGVALEKVGGLDGEAINEIQLTRRRPDQLPQIMKVNAETVLLPGDILWVYVVKRGFIASSARQLVEWMASDKFDLAVISFDKAMLVSMPEGRLRANWQGIQKQLGVFRRRGDVRTEINDGHHLGIVTCEFSNGRAEVSVDFNLEGRVTALSIMPVTVK